jgi:dTMP kinase
MKPNYIAIEGLEGAGKTSAMDTVFKFLTEELGLRVKKVREPGGTPLAEDLRNIFKIGDYGNEIIDKKTEAMLMYSSRNQLLTNIVSPALKQDYTVLTDRSKWSSMAYQGGDLELFSFLQDLDKHICKKQPNLVIFMDVDPENGLARASVRGELDNIEKRKIDFFIECRERFLTFAKENPNLFIVIDANQTIEKVQEDILLKLKEIFN